MHNYPSTRRLLPSKRAQLLPLSARPPSHPCGLFAHVQDVGVVRSWRLPPRLQRKARKSQGAFSRQSPSGRYRGDPRMVGMPGMWNICQRSLQAASGASQRERPCEINHRTVGQGGSCRNSDVDTTRQTTGFNVPLIDFVSLWACLPVVSLSVSTKV